MEYLKQKDLPINPREGVHCCSYLCFWCVILFHNISMPIGQFRYFLFWLKFKFILKYCSWIFPIFRAGRKHDYDANDLYKPLKVHESKLMGDRLCDAWDNELKSQRETGRKPSLLRATLRVFGVEFILLGILLFVLEVFLK